MRLGHMMDSQVFQGGKWDYMGRMMGINEGSGARILLSSHWILGVITWIILIALIVALTRYFWLKGDEVKKKK